MKGENNVQTQHRILLCEDELSLGTLIKKFFESNGIEVVLERDGKLGLAAFRKQKFSLCLLDVMMPNMDGVELAKEIRMISKNIPIIFITAKSMKQDTIAGYAAGADDYITKPFDIDLLLLKIKKILERHSLEQPNKQYAVIKIGSLYSYNIQSRELKCSKDETRYLSPIEGDLLMLLYKHRTSFLAREEALKEIWSDNSAYPSRSMDVYITKLRRLFSKDPKIQINNIHSMGFVLILK